MSRTRIAAATSAVALTGALLVGLVSPASACCRPRMADGPQVEQSQQLAGGSARLGHRAI